MKRQQGINQSFVSEKRMMKTVRQNDNIKVIVFGKTEQGDEDTVELRGATELGESFLCGYHSK